ncbi:MAG: SDR family NAD(P)-dependent oxidoreductase [Pseudobdellovibrionaceae bacterium]|nr:SDR family NAD(P)-dependent oxidoreductase [Pseudobdellovibrionaceae bacterium]
MALDLADLKDHAAAFATAKNALGRYDSVFIAHGILGDQTALQKDFSLTQKALNVNLLSVLSLLTIAANELEAQGKGHIGVITSVAGDRGRQSNYIYGMCKGSISIFLSGLRNRLFSKGVFVTDIKLGFVDSPMTRHITNKGLLWKKPDAVGRIIVKAMDGKGGIRYVPGFWRFIMLIIKSIPDSIFRRLSL